MKRFENPHTYYVDLSQKLFDIKQDSALPEHMANQPPRPPAGLFVHRILVAEYWVFRYNNKISGRS